jgi:hypothetical protein
MPVRTYDSEEIPARRRSTHEELAAYALALRQGKAVGDGIEYRESRAARREAVRIYSQVRRRADELGLSRVRQRVWESEPGVWLWAVIPEPDE